MSNSSLTKFKDKKGNSYPYLYIDQKSGVFYVRKRVGEVVRSASLETTDFNKARQMVLDKASDLSKVEVAPKKNLIFGDFFEQMIAEKTANKTSPETLRRIDSVWRHSLKPFWEYLRPEDIDQERVIEFMNWHRRNRPGIQFVNVFKYLGNVFAVMVERGAIPPNKRPKLDLPKDEERHHQKQKGRYITDDEAKALLEHSEGAIHIVIAIGLTTGMRKMEMGSLELSRLRLLNGRYIVKLDTDDTKTGLAREVPLPDRLTPLIKAQINSKSKYLFPMKTDLNRPISGQLIDSDWNETKEKAKIQGRLRFHDMRHTAASNFAKANVNPFVAVTILGMSFATYQNRYLKLKTDDLIIGSETNADRLWGSK